MSKHPNATAATINHHLQAFFRASVDGVVEDYAEEAIFVTGSGPLRGRGEIRGFFKAFIETLPPGFMEVFKVRKLEFVDEVGYLVWEAAPWVQFATDTFIVRDGRIVAQTFAAHPPVW
jgi:ketosteroid isomerase-like protein